MPNYRSRMMYDFSILQPTLEEMGYNVYYVSERLLKARRFPYHFNFRTDSKRTEISFHLDRNTLGGHIKRKKNTSRQLLPEYHRIVKRYKIARDNRR